MQLSKGLINDLRRALRGNRYEEMPGGKILLTDAKLILGGAVRTSLLFGPSYLERGADTQLDVGDNLVVTQGIVLALINLLANGTQVPSWYLMPFKGSGAPQATWTGANVAANAQEFTNYTEATRPGFVFPDPTTITTASISNAASLAVTTIDSGADKTLWGGAVVSNPTKGGNDAGDKLVAAVKFGAARSGLQTGDGIGWEYLLAGTSS